MTTTPTTHNNEAAIRLVIAQFPELGLSATAFSQEVERRGKEVALYRDYRSGEHRNFLTDNQRRIINLPPPITRRHHRAGTTVSDHDFNTNYCFKVVQTMAARITVNNFILVGEDDTGTTELTQWEKDLKRLNRFDSLQKQTHLSAIGDRESFVIADWNEDAQRVTWNIEPTYDAHDGLIVLYAQDGQTIVFAIKIWHLADTEGALTRTRINIYTPDSVIRFLVKQGGALLPFPNEEESILDWPLGFVPIVPFINRREAYTSEGKSEIKDIIGMQDALNYALYSMTASSAMTGFGLYDLIGHEAPETIEPGMVFSANHIEQDDDGNDIVTAPVQSDGVNTYFKPEVRRVPGQGPGPYVEQANWLIEQISVITDTPIPQFMGGSGESGEALKQRESGLIAKAETAHVEFGNSWENLIGMSHAIHNYYLPSAPLPALSSVTARWEPAELRSGIALIEAVVQLKSVNLIDQQTALEAVSFVFGWSVEDIKIIVERLGAETTTALLGGANQIPGLGF